MLKYPTKQRLLLFILFFVAISTNTNTFGKSHHVVKNTIIGSWKYTTKTIINDFQRISNINLKTEYSTEYFIFSSDKSFRHEFLNKEGAVVKVLTGKWKLYNKKIKIDYVNFSYNLNLDYFFLDKYLVLGQNFNNIIFSKDDIDNHSVTSMK